MKDLTLMEGILDYLSGSLVSDQVIGQVFLPEMPLNKQRGKTTTLYDMPSIVDIKRA